MAAPFLNRKSVVLAKVETTYGTDPTPVVGTNAILSTVPQISLDNAILERTVTVGTLSPTQPVIGRKLWGATFGVELKSQSGILAGSSSAPLELDPILRMAGFQATYTAETTLGANDGYVTYNPRSDSIESATMYLFPGKEMRHKMTGAYANLNFDIAAGQYAMINVDAKGIYNEPTDTAATTPTYATAVPQMVESISLAFGAVTSQVVRNLSINMNNEIPERADVNSAEGFKGLRIAARKPEVTFRIEKMLAATWNIYNALDSGTTYSTTFTIGSVAGKKILVTIPKLTLTSIKESDDNGLVMLDVTGLCARNSDAGDDELTFKFF